MPLMSKSVCVLVGHGGTHLHPLPTYYTITVHSPPPSFPPPHTHTHSLPLIVTTFNAPAALCEAVKREVERWQKRGLRYFSSGSVQEDEIEKLGAALKDLQLKR